MSNRKRGSYKKVEYYPYLRKGKGGWSKTSTYYDIYDKSEFNLIETSEEHWVYFKFQRDIGKYERLPHYLMSVRRLLGNDIYWEFEDDWSGAIVWTGINNEEVENIEILESFYHEFMKSR